MPMASHPQGLAVEIEEEFRSVLENGEVPFPEGKIPKKENDDITA